MTDRTRLTVHAWLLWGLGLGALGIGGAERWLIGAGEAATPLVGVGLAVCGNALIAVRDRLEGRASATPGAGRGAP
jgi:hypothetical protein